MFKRQLTVVAARGNIKYDGFAFVIPEWGNDGNIGQVGSSGQGVICANVVAWSQLASIDFMLIANGVFHA